jgi:hypothetical protein
VVEGCHYFSKVLVENHFVDSFCIPKAAIGLSYMFYTELALWFRVLVALMLVIREKNKLLL